MPDRPAYVDSSVPGGPSIRYYHPPYQDAVYLRVERDDVNKLVRFRSEEGATGVTFTVPLELMGHFRGLLDRADPEGSAAGDHHVGARRVPGLTTVRDEELTVLVEAARSLLAALGREGRDEIERVASMYEADPLT